METAVGWATGYILDIHLHRSTIANSSENIELGAIANIANPEVEDLEGGDYHLTSSSPARDNGADEGHYDMDLDGNPIVGTRDIGAFEYQSE